MKDSLGIALVLLVSMIMTLLVVRGLLAFIADFIN